MNRNWTPAATCLLLIATGASAVPPADNEAPVATEQLGGTVLSVTPQIAYEGAVLRVSGPEGYALTKRFPAGTPITVDLLADAEAVRAEPPARGGDEAGAGWSALPDGRYRYEVVFDEGAGERRRHTGMFFARAGAAVSREATQSALEATRVALLDAAGPGAPTSGDPGAQGTNVDDWLRILDTDQDGITYLLLQGHDNPPNDDADWRVFNFFGDLYFLAASPGNAVVQFDFDGNVGIDTFAPQAKLHVVDTYPELLLDDSSTNGTSFELQIFSDDIFEIEGDSFPVRIQYSAPYSALFVGEDGIGLGTSGPTSDLDIRNVDGSGNTAVRFTNSDTTWSNAVRSSDGNFVFNRIGSGGAEFTVRPRLDADGATLDVQGSVRGTQFISTSSREVKTAFEDLQPVDVLTKLAALPVSAWRYVWEDASARHVGPVAEDFQRLFGLGDGKTIGTVDADGVLMAAVQGLKRLLDAVRAETAAKDGQISELRAANAKLEARLAALEARLSPPSP